MVLKCRPADGQRFEQQAGTNTNGISLLSLSNMAVNISGVHLPPLPHNEAQLSNVP